MVAALEQESIRLLLYTVHLFSCAIIGLYEGQTTIQIIQYGATGEPANPNRESGRRGNQKKRHSAIQNGETVDPTQVKALQKNAMDYIGSVRGKHGSLPHNREAHTAFQNTVNGTVGLLR